MEWKTFFHTRFCALYLQENAYRCRVVINNTVTEVFHCNISTRIICHQIAVLWLFILRKYCIYCIIVKYVAICSIDVIVDDFDRFNCFFF